MIRLSAHRRPLAGFTLIELLIVIIIVGILIAIGVPAYLKYTAAANDRDAQAALHTAYKAAVAGDTEVNSGRFPIASTVVNDVKADEPAESVARGDCVSTVATGAVKQVFVDPASTSQQVTMCVKSASGSIWRLTGPLAGNPTISDGSSVPLTFSGNELTDAARLASASWTTAQTGTQTDGTTPVGGTFVGRAATNLFRHGQDDSATDWGVSGANITRTVDTTVRAPFSTQSLRYDITSGTPWAVATSNTGQAAAAGTLGVGSIYFEGQAGLLYKVAVMWRDTGGTPNWGPATSVVATGGWQLLVPAPFAVPSSLIGDTVEIGVAPAVSRADTFWLAHAMLERGQTAVAPYVATSGGATATHPAGRVQVPASVLNPSQGWAAIRIRQGMDSGAVTSNKHLFSWRTDNSNRIGLVFNGTSFQTRFANGGLGPIASQTKVYNDGDFTTAVLAWTSGATGMSKVSIDGAPFSSATHGLAAPTLPTTFDIGTFDGASDYIDSDVIWFATGTGTLTDGDAATIAGWGSSDPKRSSFPAAAQATMVWDGVSSSGSLK